MTLLALRNLISEKTRFAFSAAGIGFAVFLITIQLGLYQGWNNKVGGFVEKVDADAWVARQGTTDFINAASILPVSLGDDLAEDKRIAGVYPMIVRPMALLKDGKEVNLHLIGYDEASGVGGPLKIVKGRGDPAADEIVVDESLSRTEGVGIGDELTNGDSTVRVVGLSSGGNFVFTQASFMGIEPVRELLGMQGLTTFYVLRMEDASQFEGWRGEFTAQNQDLKVFTSKEFASSTRERILGDVLPIIGLIVGLAFIVGIAITSLTIYTTTVEKTREFGVMKAIGFNNADLYRLVMSQSLLIGLFGFAFGVTLTLVLSQFVDKLVPQFTVLVRPIDIAFVLVATLVMALGAAIVPARRVGSLDPDVVFRG